MRVPDHVIDTVERLHAAVDQLTKPLHERHRARLQCKAGCSGCCVDDLSVFAIEAALIERHHATLLASQAPHSPGRCAFLDAEGKCRIYRQRPYVCRTQGLPLRWVELDATAFGDGSVHELRDICALNETAEPLQDIAKDDCWSLGPVEDKLRELQDHVAPGERVKLRALFKRSAARAGAQRDQCERFATRVD